MRVVPRFVWLSTLACVLAALWPLAMRHQVESSNRAVGIMMEMEDVAKIAVASGKNLDQALKELKDHGLVGVAMTEETLGDLLLDGRASLLMGREVLGPSKERVDAALSQYADRSGSQSGDLLGSGVVKDVLKLPVGLDPDRVLAARSAGVQVTARFGNYPGLTARSVEATLRRAKVQGATSYLINGDQAIGNRALLETTETLLRETGLHYLSPEFVQLGGDSALRKNLQSQTIRLHSISQAEIEKLSDREVTERVVKAFEERDVRWILLRPPSQASLDPLKSASEWLFNLSRAIRGSGGEVKSPRPFNDPTVPDWFPGVIALLAMPAMLWTVLEVVGRSKSGRIIGAIVVIVCAGSFLPEIRGLGALMAATVFPVLGFMIAFQSVALKPVARYVAASGVGMVGGVCVAGMLVGLEYMLRVEAFQGVKLAMFAPIAIVGWLLLQEQGGIQRHLKSPVTWMAAIIGVLALVVLALLATRSGNDNPAAVSSLELNFRSLLDRVLLVRPRTKEAFFGHPALLIAAFLMANRPRSRPWIALLILAGMAGQTSMVNTLCHLHTPVVLSLMRNLVGLIVGGILGFVLWALIQRWPVNRTGPS